MATATLSPDAGIAAAEFFTPAVRRLYARRLWHLADFLERTGRDAQAAVPNPDRRALAFLPEFSGVMVRLSGTDRRMLTAFAGEIRGRCREYIYGGRGDTLEGIARANRVPLASILDWNDLGTSVITPGQVLFLPGARMPAGDIAKALGTLFVWPLKGKLTSRYGMRVGPVDGIDRFHYGIDIKADVGTQVLAAAAGGTAITPSFSPSSAAWHRPVRTRHQSTLNCRPMATMSWPAMPCRARCWMRRARWRASF